MARHDALLTAVFERHAGVVVRPRGEGDSLFCVFVRASDAVAAALAGQRALAAEDWGEVGPLRVRMALHTGEADLREGDYYGAAVNRCARLRAAGHGGQVLLSAATARLVRETLPPGATLTELGRHRLRDLSEPEQVFQLAAAGLPETFPPLNTLDARPNNLPLALTSFIGREDEVAAVAALLRHAGTRLVTITGVGGAGKTRLALQVAAALLDDFPDGVLFVDLAPLTDPTLVASAIAHVLGISETGARPLAQSLAIALHDRATLLLLDNFEQLMPAAALVAELLAACPRLRLLTTSRAPLRVTGEREYPLAPLPVPEDGRTAPGVAAQNAAVALFVDRARAVLPGFGLTDGNAAAVAAICARLDGLPLAIELAAGRARLLPPEALLARLERRLPLLVGGARDAPLRQQTLRNAIAWSYDLLGPAEQALLRRLAVFVTGFGLEMAEAVCSAEAGAAGEVLEGIATLAEHSLLQPRPAVAGEPRFAMLETIREFALERLAESGEEAAVRERHARALLALAEASEPGMKGAQHGVWQARLTADRDNLRLALGWLRAKGQIEEALNFVGALWLWFHTGATQEDRRQIEELLALPAAAGCGAARARALFTAGRVALQYGLSRTSVARFAGSAARWRELGDSRSRALAQAGQAAALSYSEPAAARLLAEDSVAALRSSGDQFGLGWALDAQVMSVLNGGDPDAAKPLCEEALAIFSELGDPWAPARPLFYLGLIAFAQGDDAEAIALAERSIALERASGARLVLPHGIELAGRAALRRGEVGRAEAALAEALRLRWEDGILWGTAQNLSAFGLSAVARGALPAAVRLFAAASALESASETGLRPAYRADAERALRSAREELGEGGFAQAWREGRALTPAQAVAAALALAAEPVPEEPAAAALAREPAPGAG